MLRQNLCMKAKEMTKATFWTTYKPEYKTLLSLGFPVLMTQLGVITMSFADTLMVGAYSVEALASSAFVNSLFLIPLVMLSGLANGITPLVGALFSRNSLPEAGRISRAALQLNSLIGILFTMLMGSLWFLLHKFGQPSELLPLIRPYFLTLLGTLLPMALFNSFCQICTGMTDTQTPMWCVLFSILVNIFGNWLLIFGKLGCPELGLTGAGVATVIARLSGLIAIIFSFLTSPRYAQVRKGYRLGTDGARRYKVWCTSYPVMIQSGIECALWSFGAVVCGWFGKIQLAAYQVVNTIGQLGFMTFMSFGVAVSVRVANCTGLHDEKGIGIASRAGLHINLVLCTIASLAIWILAPQLIELFTSDRQVIQAALLFVLPLVLYQYLDATQLTLINAIRGTSQVKPLLWIALTSYIFVGMPCSLLFSVVFGWEAVGVYFSFDVALLVAAIYAGIVFKKTKLK